MDSEAVDAVELRCETHLPRISGRDTWTTFSSCPYFSMAFSGFYLVRLRQERRVAYPAPAMSAGDKLRIVKAKKLSLVSGA